MTGGGYDEIAARRYARVESRPDSFSLRLAPRIQRLFEHGRDVEGIAPEARAALVRYPWPGNVRELRNVVENMVLLARGTILEIDDVPASVRGASSSGPVAGGYELAGRSLADVERELIRTNLDLVSGNRQKASKMLEIGERTLYRKIKEYDL